jgi:16S rRNA processing protein RimM
MESRRVTLGRVSGVYGVKGWIKVYSYTRPAENILRYRKWWIAAQTAYAAEVVSGQQHNQALVVQITDSSGQPIDDRDRAAALIGAEIQVEREALPKLAAGEFYWIDLIGAKVESVDGAALGVVSDVTSNGAQDVLVLKDGEVERLIPFVMQHIVREVDVDGGRIVCDWQADW